MKLPITPHSKQELQSYADTHKLSRLELQQIYNEIPGATPRKRLRNRPTAIEHIWEHIKPKEAVTKREQLIAKLKAGCTLEGLMSELGWQRHTVRGLISTLQTQGKIKVTVQREGKRVVGYQAL